MDRAPELHALLERVVGSGADGLAALTDLRGRLDGLETELVATALRQGWSWSRIGEALGISKQAAHRRHRRSAASLDHAAEAEHRGRPVIIAGDVRRAVALARQEAAAGGRASVGTEHLLLGLMRAGDGPAQRALERLGVRVNRARSVAEATVEVSRSDAAAARGTREAVISPLARTALEDALRARADAGAGTLTSADLLSALLREAGGGAARTLERLGVGAAAVEAELRREAGRA